MKLTIQRSKILDALRKVQSVVPSKPTMQICSHVKCAIKSDELAITATDLDVSMTAKVKGVKCDADGVFTAPAKFFCQCLETMPEGEIAITPDEEEMKVVVSSATSRVKLQSFKADQFPKWSKEEVEFACVMKGVDVREMLRKTAYAASKNQSRKTLMGSLVQFKDGVMGVVATDGRMLASVSKVVGRSEGKPRDVILPQAVVAEFCRVFGDASEMTLRITENHVIASSEGIVICAKLMADVYPIWKQVVPDGRDNEVSLNRAHFVAAIERACIFVDVTNQRMKCTFADNKLIVESDKCEYGSAKEEIPVKYENSAVEIYFDPSLLVSMFKALSADEVSFGFNSGHEPCTVKSAEYDFSGVVMPLRAN